MSRSSNYASLRKRKHRLLLAEGITWPSSPGKKMTSGFTDVEILNQWAVGRAP